MAVKDKIASLARFRQEVIGQKNKRITVDRYGVPIIRSGLTPFVSNEQRRKESVETQAEVVIDVDAIADKVAAKLQGALGAQPQTTIDEQKLLSEIKNLVQQTNQVADNPRNGIITPLSLDEPTAFISNKQFDTKITIKPSADKGSLNESELDQLFNMFNTGGNNDGTSESG